MVQTNSHRFNTHVKRLSLSGSVVIIIITRFLATSRIITQYFNHLLYCNFTTSPLEIDDSLSTFQCCHSWLGTFGNWYEFLIVGSFWICVSSDTLQVGERLKLYKEENYAIKSNEYLEWCTLIFLRKKESYLNWLTLINVAFPYMQQTYFNLIMSLHLLSFPKHSKTYLKP